jgi:TATA-box binding protein (TBP) (component of TFIID and TFIIIB)
MLQISRDASETPFGHGLAVYKSPYPRTPLPRREAQVTRQTKRARGAVQIANVVSMFELNTPLSLNEFCLRHTFCELHRKTFASVKVHLTNPRTTCLLSSSSKAVCTGARDMHTSYLAAQIYADMIAEVTGRSNRMTRFLCVNQTATVNLGVVLDLHGIDDRLATESKFAPGFPCAFVKVWPDRDLRHILSVRGNVVVTGARSETDITRSLASMMPLYEQFSFPIGSVEAETLVRRTDTTSRGSKLARDEMARLVDDDEVDGILSLMIDAPETAVQT